MVGLKLYNGAKHDSYALKIEDQYIANIGANEQKILQLQKLFHNRGYQDFGSVEVVSFFPFGHIRFSKKIQIEGKFLIYPEPSGVDLKKAFAKELANYGAISSFDRLQNYIQGESISKIHWPSVAKGELQSKKFTYENDDMTLHFYFMQAGSSTEQRLSQLSLWVV